MRGSNLAEKSNILEGHFAPTSLRVIETINPLDELLNRKPIRQHIYEFAVVFGIVFNLIGAWLIWRKEMLAAGLVLAAASIVLAWFGKTKPATLQPLWKGWMMVGAVLGTIVTTALLSIMWLGMFVPLAFVLRIIGRMVMDTSFRKPVPSYFEDRKPESNDFRLLERQY